MPVPDKVYLSTPSDTSTSALGVTGEIREHIHETYGKQYYRMVKNTSGSTIAANLAVVFVTSGTSGSSLEVALSGAAAPSATVAGITQNAIANNEYGWVVCAGDCLATSAAAVDVSTLATAMTAASGELDDTAISTKEHCIIGVFLADKASGGTVRTRISGLM
mgnify:CR=1 FL=1